MREGRGLAAGLEVVVSVCGLAILLEVGCGGAFGAVEDAGPNEDGGGTVSSSGGAGADSSAPSSADGASPEAGGKTDGGAPVVAADGGGYGWVGTTSAAGFHHPGVVVTLGALDYVRDRLGAGDPLYSSALAMLTANPWPGPSTVDNGMLPAIAHYPPSGTVYCGAHSAGPPGDTSCQDERNDAIASYTHALLWVLTGDEDHAKAAVTMLNAWAPLSANQALTAADKGVLCPPTPCAGCGHIGYASAPPGSNTASCHDNTPLQSAWVGTVWARAAELVRYTYPQGWTSTDVAAFVAMLERAYVPNLQPKGALTQNGNWELSAAEALLQIAVFADDMPNYQNAVTKWRNRMPLYFYLQSDGASPKAGGDVQECFTEIGNTDSHGCGVDSWWGIANATGLPDGTSQENCRDLEHVQYGLGAAINAAETAAIQHIAGADLYHDATKNNGYRLFAAMELEASILAGRSDAAASPDLSNVSLPAHFPCSWAPSWSWGAAPQSPMSAQCAATAFTCDGENYSSTATTGASGSSLAVVDNAQVALGARGIYAKYPVEPTWEIGYNQYVARDGLAMPNTAALLSVAGNRPNGATHHLDWEALTNYGTKGYGLP
jgi:hypothetical protein